MQNLWSLHPPIPFSTHGREPEQTLVSLPILENILALVYLVISCVTVNVPKAAEPLHVLPSPNTLSVKMGHFLMKNIILHNRGPRTPTDSEFHFLHRVFLMRSSIFIYFIIYSLMVYVENYTLIIITKTFF
jgi:hypothetical protein